MTQLSLLDEPIADTKPRRNVKRARTTDPQTSKDAADKVKEQESWSVVAGFMEAIGRPATSEEIVAFADRIGSKYSQSRIRGSLGPDEMLSKGYVRIVSEDGGTTKRGNSCKVYELTDAGRKKLL